jgi:hypothetical protein
MPVAITINDVSGTSPFNIYVCDNPITTCIYINTITSSPYEFEIPKIFVKLPSVNLKIVDNNGCETATNLTL